MTDGIERALADADSIDVVEGTSFLTGDPLVYRPSPKHKRRPSRGVKGTFCPRDVDADALLARSYRLEGRARERWATSGGCAFCARPDNAGGWHGYPVRFTEVPIQIIRRWLRDGLITARELRSDRLCQG